MFKVQLLLYDGEMRIDANGISFNHFPSVMMRNRSVLCLSLRTSAKVSQLGHGYRARDLDAGGHSGKTTMCGVSTANCVTLRISSHSFDHKTRDCKWGRILFDWEAARYGRNGFRIRSTPNGAHSPPLMHLHHWLYHPNL